MLGARDAAVGVEGLGVESARPVCPSVYYEKGGPTRQGGPQNKE